MFENLKIYFCIVGILILTTDCSDEFNSNTKVRVKDVYSEHLLNLVEKNEGKVADKIYIEVNDSVKSALDKDAYSSYSLGHTEKKQHPEYACTILQGEDTVTGGIRLKGKWQDHYSPGKYSLRISAPIRLGENDRLNFSLMHPKTRSYLNEWLFQRLSKQMGIASLRYDFVKVYINGSYRGVFSKEEHPGTYIGSQECFPLVVVRFNQDEYFESVFDEPNSNNDLLDSVSFYNSKIDIYNERYLRDLGYVSCCDSAINLLDGFRNETLSMIEVFDMDKLSAYFAVCDLMACIHALRWHNVRFIYDRKKQRLAPVSYDGSSGVVPFKLSIQHDADPFLRKVFSDSLFCRYYFRALQQISMGKELADFLKENKGDIFHNYLILKCAYPEMEFSMGEIIERRNEIYRQMIRI